MPLSRCSLVLRNACGVAARPGKAGPCSIALAVLAACSSTSKSGADEPATAIVVDAAVVATAPPPPPPPRPDAAPVPVPLDRDAPVLAGRVVELYQAVGEALATAGTDCRRAVTGLAAVKERFRETRDAVARVVAEGRSAALEAELDRRQAPISAAMARMQTALDACRADAKFNEALEGLAGGG